MFWSLIICLCFVSLIQSCKKRRIVASWFTGATILHEIFFGHTDGLMYFASAGIICFIIAIGICKFISEYRLVKGLLIICGISVFANWLGWIMWENYFEPEIINLPFILIYSAAIALILREEADVGLHQDDMRTLVFFGHSYQGRNYCRNIQ